MDIKDTTREALVGGILKQIHLLDPKKLLAQDKDEVVASYHTVIAYNLLRQDEDYDLYNMESFTERMKKEMADVLMKHYGVVDKNLVDNVTKLQYVDQLLGERTVVIVFPKHQRKMKLLEAVMPMMPELSDNYLFKQVYFLPYKYLSQYYEHQK